MEGDQFIPQQGYYRNLRVYQLAEMIFDITYHFANRFLSKGDRTIDQMVQAARSGKQNIAEGSAAGSTSKETEIKLTNVAKASLQELLIDYEDYLRVRGLNQWGKDSAKVNQTRSYCNGQRESSEIMKKLPDRSDETIANIAITLIHQADRLLFRLIERQKRDFLQNGGIREQMSRARREYRNGTFRSSGSSERTMSFESPGRTMNNGSSKRTMSSRSSMSNGIPNSFHSAHNYHSSQRPLSSHRPPISPKDPNNQEG